MNLGIFASVLNRFLWPKSLFLMVVEVAANLLVMAGVGGICLFLVISRSSESLKKMELNGAERDSMRFF